MNYQLVFACDDSLNVLTHPQIFSIPAPQTVKRGRKTMFSQQFKLYLLEWRPGKRTFSVKRNTGPDTGSVQTIYI